MTLTIGLFWALQSKNNAPVAIMAGVDSLIVSFWLGALNWHPEPGILFTVGVFALVCGVESYITQGKKYAGA